MSATNPATHDTSYNTTPQTHNIHQTPSINTNTTAPTQPNQTYDTTNTTPPSLPPRNPGTTTTNPTNTTTYDHTGTVQTPGTATTSTAHTGSTGSKVKEGASGVKGIVAGIHGVGETLRGKFNSAVDEAFDEPTGVAKNEAIANAGTREVETGQFSHGTKEREGVVPGDKRAI